MTIASDKREELFKSADENKNLLTFYVTAQQDVNFVFNALNLDDSQSALNEKINLINRLIETHEKINENE